MEKIRSLTRVLAVAGAVVNFVLVFVGADPGTLEGLGILLGVFLGAMCAGPYLLAWIYPTGKRAGTVSVIIMLITTLAAISFSLFAFGTFLTASGSARDPFILAAIPVYLWGGLGAVAAISQFIANRS